MEYKRADRVAESLRREISQIALRELKDPRIQMVTVTRVELTPDLRYAKVYVSFLSDTSQTEKALQGLESAAGYIRRLLKHRLDLRRIPEIVFELDRGAEYSIHVEETLEHLKETMDEGQGTNEKE